MMQINILCVNLDAEIVNAMRQHEVQTNQIHLDCFATNLEHLPKDMTAHINVLLIRMSKQLTLPQLQIFKETWPHIAIMAYLDDENTILRGDYLAVLHGVCHASDVVSSNFLNAVCLALSIKRREIKTDVYFQMAKCLADLMRFQDATIDILKVICQRFAWRVGEIWAFNELLEHFTFVAGFSNDDQYVTLQQLNSKYHFKKSQGLPGWFADAQQVTVLNDFKSHLDEVYFSAIEKNSLTSCVGVKIVFHQKLLGTMIFWSDQPIVIDDGVRALLQDIGSQFGEFIKKKRLQGDLLYLSEHDPLTRLANRTVLENNWEQAVLSADRNHYLVALLYIDIDSFKELNDTHGHLVGDTLLRNIADCLRTCVRETDTLARVGGDEFAVLLPKITDITHVESVSKKILYALSHLDAGIQDNYTLSASIGISLYPYHGARFDTLMLYADKALYIAKKMGKNTFKIYDYQVTSIKETKSTLSYALKNAIRYNEFKLYYQPIVDVASNNIVGVESLLRWPLAPPSISSPEMFIAFAEENNLIDKIGEWVLKNACHDAVRIMQITKQPFKLVVNISPVQMTREFVSLVASAIKQTHLHPAMLTIELTERNLMDSSDYTLQVLTSLRAMGVKLSIDDFGVGYSSFLYLNTFPVDAVKIDRTFVDTMLNLASGKAIVSAILAVADTLDIEVIAEGVENQAQLDFLRAHHCDYYQGRLFKDALPVDELLALLAPAKAKPS